MSPRAVSIDELSPELRHQVLEQKRAAESGSSGRRASTRSANADQKAARRALTPTEHQEQCAVIEWAGLQEVRHPEFELLYAIPNFAGKYGSKTARRIAGGRAKHEGRRKDFPDLCLPVARGWYHSLYIELKRDDPDARATAGQKSWLKRLAEEGHCVAVCTGAEMCKRTLLDYLNRKA